MSESQARSLAIMDASVRGMNGIPLRSPPHLRLATRSAGGRESPLHMRSDASVVETHLPILNEDLAPLSAILHTLGLVATYRPEGESTLRPLPGPATRAANLDLATPGSVAPSIPLLHPNGRRHGHLGVICTQELPDYLGQLLEASLSLAAKAISERWFRLEHHKGWVVAAAPVANPGRGLLLALDRKLALRGMDAQAHAWLEAGSIQAHRARWEDLFRPVTPLPTLRARADIPLRLIGARDGEPWTAILTGPDFSSGVHSYDALLHARPRLHRLVDLMKSEPDQSLQIPSLTPGMRKKIEEYVEAHLDAELPVERLAQAAGMSSSHFTRAFRNVLRMPPHRYVMWRRLLRAQELIRSSDASLADIALVTGFADQSHLCRLFQSHIGETPSRYRRRCR